MRLYALQYLRALAALAVVYHHATLQSHDYAAVLPGFGAFGVDVFFVISGFIMVWIAREDDTPGRFMANRIRRVVPLYWFFTLLMAAILLLVPHAFRNSAFDAAALIKSLVFLPHESSAHAGELWPIVAPGWSLNYEMYFYVLFALSLMVPMRWRVATISAAITLVFAGAVAVAGHMDAGVNETAGGQLGALVSFFSESIVYEFVLGMLIGVAYRRGWRLPSSTGWLLAILGLSLLALELPILHILRYGVPAALVVIGCLFLAVPHSRFGVLVGDASYALYLSHVFVLGALRWVLPPRLEAWLGTGALAAWTFVVIALTLCVAVSLVVHALIDNWLLRHERVDTLLGRPSDARSSKIRLADR